MKKIILILNALIFISCGNSSVSSQILEIKENYYQDKNGEISQTYSDYEKTQIELPIYANLVPQDSIFYPNFFLGGEYEIIYIFDENNKLAECEIINYNKNKENIKYNYDTNGYLSSINSRNKKISFPTTNRDDFIETTFRDTKIIFSINNGLISKIENGGGKIDALEFYHNQEKNVIEMSINDFKRLHYYKNNLCYKVEDYQKGKLLEDSTINIKYEFDSNNNWTKKTITTKNKIYIVKREIVYKGKSDLTSFEGTWTLTSNFTESNPVLTITKNGESYTLKGDGRIQNVKIIKNKLTLDDDDNSQINSYGYLQTNNILIFKHQGKIVSRFRRVN